MPHRKLTLRKNKNKNKKYSKVNRRKLTNKKRKQYGGSSVKLKNIIQDIFYENVIKYLPSTFVFLDKMESKYVWCCFI